MNKQLRPLITKVQLMLPLLFDAGFWTAIAAWGGGLVAASAIWALILANQESAEKDKAFEKYKTESERAIADANLSAAWARKEASESKLEQERMKMQLAWRTVSPQARTALAATLGAADSITIAYTANDPEALAFAAQLSYAFVDAGWTVNAESRTYAQQVLFNLFVNGNTAPSERVRAALNAVGLPFSNTEVPIPAMAFNAINPAPPTLLMVGSKQPPF